MRDVFYTLLVIWVVMQIYKSFSKGRQPSGPAANQRHEGDITINTNSNGANKNDNRGEYVDFEEIKD
jgi:hypothetical protein